MVFTGLCKYGLPKNAIYVTRTRVSLYQLIDTTKKFLDDRSSLEKNAYKIGLIPIIS